MMDIIFDINTTNGKDWTATCKDPVLEVTGNDIISVSRKMAAAIEEWFTKTFNTTRQVVVKVPAIKARIKAEILVRSETPLNEFAAPEEATTQASLSQESTPTIMRECTICGMEIFVKENDPTTICDTCKYEQEHHANEGADEISHVPQLEASQLKDTTHPCGYLSDGTGVLPIGHCEAVSNESADTPGIQVDWEGCCNGNFAECPFYQAQSRYVTGDVV